MRIGVVFPTLEVTDPGAIRDYAQAAEDLGYAHLRAWEHVVGADLRSRPDWTGPATLQAIHEPLVLFGYLAAVTQRLELVTGVLALAQRQTVLVAKQAAEVDVLSGGRLRLGVGLGWVEPEFRALNETFTDRGRRIQEQLAVLRAVFTKEVVTFSGRWHDLDAVGIAPLPTPADPDLDRRPGRCGLASGGGAGRWVDADDRPTTGATRWVHQPAAYLCPRAGSGPGQHRYRPGPKPGPRRPGPEGDASLRTLVESMRDLEVWQALGATHVTVNTMGAASRSQEHLDVIQQFKEVVDAAPNPSRIRLRSVRTTDRDRPRPITDHMQTNDGRATAHRGRPRSGGARSWAAATVDVGASGSPKSERPSSLLCSAEF